MGHGHASPPTWFAEWKAALDAEKEAAAKVEAAAKEAKTKEAAAKVAAARASSPSGVEGSTVTTVVPPTTGDAAVQVGQTVRVRLSGGKKGKDEVCGVVHEVLTKHCWVLFVNDKGVKTGGRKRVMTDKLKIEPTPVPVLDPVIASESCAAVAAETDADTAGQAAQEAEAAAKQAAEAAKAEVAWEDCANVF